MARAFVAQSAPLGLTTSVLRLSMITPRENLAAVASATAPDALFLALWEERPSSGSSSTRALTDLLRAPVPLMAVAVQNSLAVVQALVVVFRFDQHELRASLLRLKRPDVAIWLLPLEEETEATPADVAAWAATTEHLTALGFSLNP